MTFLLKKVFWNF